MYIIINMQKKKKKNKEICFIHLHSIHDYLSVSHNSPEKKH